MFSANTHPREENTNCETSNSPVRMNLLLNAVSSSPVLILFSRSGVETEIAESTYLDFFNL